MHTHTISFNYPPITNDCLIPVGGPNFASKKVSLENEIKRNARSAISVLQPLNFHLAMPNYAYIHAEGMYGCETRYLVLYMRFWSTCLFFMKPSLPASPITRCVLYPEIVWYPACTLYPPRQATRNVWFLVRPLPNKSLHQHDTL